MGTQKLTLSIVKFSADLPLSVEDFCCGQPELDDFLKKHLAKQHMDNILKAYLLITNEDTPRVMGFYTLSGGSYAKASMTRSHQKQVPYRDTSCITLGRLAIDRRIARQGFGTQLVLDALRVAYYAADAVGIYAVMVDAKDEQAAIFYRKMGFIALKSAEGQLKFFFPVTSIKSLL